MTFVNTRTNIFSMTEAQMEENLQKFPPEMRPFVISTIAGLSGKIPQNSETHWTTGEAYVEASYAFARAIDPNFKTWQEKDGSYKANRQTEKYLVMFYELAKQV